jgi:hypothetical protein
LDAVVHNSCGEVAIVTVSFAYFDQNGVQHPGESTEVMTVASGSSVHFYHLATWERDRWHLKLVKIANASMALQPKSPDC